MPAPKLACVVSVSGIRGVIGDTLDANQLLQLALAFGSALAGGGVVVLGRDSRPTGAMIAQIIAGGLRAVGCTVVDIGVVPTPTVPMTIKALGAAGGMQISASHNPVEWNALKFFNREARNITVDELEWIMNAYEDPMVGSQRRWDGVGGYRADDQALIRHQAGVLAAVDASAIRSAGFKVVIDCVNGSGANLGPLLLHALGCDVVTLHARPDLPFPRDPEPTAFNLTDTAAVVKAVGAQLGFVQDPDADRLAIIDEKGCYIGEEYTLVLCAAARLAAAKAAGISTPVAVTNLSTSRMLDDVAAQLGGRVVRTKVGEAHVVDGMIAHGAVIGGEGNGGVIDPRVVMGRDSHIGMALVLELLARAEQPLSDVIAGIPRYHIHKEKVALDRAGVAAGIVQLRGHVAAAGATIDTTDGLKLSWPDRWVHLRASGTEPVSRIISEAPNAAAALALADSIRAAIGAELSAGSHS